jgi:hypothetical protein
MLPNRALGEHSTPHDIVDLARLDLRAFDRCPQRRSVGPSVALNAPL